MKAERDLTVVEAARIARVSGALIRSWCDSGELPSYRLPGRLKVRRIPLAGLRAFLVANGMGVVLEGREDEH